MTSGHSTKQRVRHDAEYGVWYGMKQRCHNPKHAHYRYYGGRGIHVCERWRESFKAFLKDMGMKPGPEYSIDRLDNPAGYHCGRCRECVENGWWANCRWATPEEQRDNRGAYSPISGRNWRHPATDPLLWKALAERRKPPVCGLHRSSGQARVKLGGRALYLGKHGSKSAVIRFTQLVNVWRGIRQRRTKSPRPRNESGTATLITHLVAILPP